MQLNPDIADILKDFNIDKSQGILYLLGVYFELNVETTCKEEVIKAVNVTKVVDIDYENKVIIWNVPLFMGQEVAFDWVGDWISGFGRINPERKGAMKDAITRMKKFFAENPQYRKEDVYKARDLYFSTVRDSKYLMKSHKFIFDGIGAMKKSTLLEYCEKVVDNSSTSNMRGTLIS